jgi:hypothetical protein
MVDWGSRACGKRLTAASPVDSVTAGPHAESAIVESEGTRVLELWIFYYGLEAMATLGAFHFHCRKGEGLTDICTTRRRKLP